MTKIQRGCGCPKIQSKRSALRGEEGGGCGKTVGRRNLVTIRGKACPFDGQLLPVVTVTRPRFEGNSLRTPKPPDAPPPRGKLHVLPFG